MRKQFVMALVLALALALGSAFGQAGVAFDVATVKPAAALDMQKIAADVQAGKMPNLGPRVNGSQATFNYMTLKELIAYAYKLKSYQVTGPDWMATQRFDIAAKLPEGASRDDAPAMLQALLKERFALVAHTDRSEHPVLALVVGKDGPKMKAATVTPVAIDESSPLKSGEMTVNTSDGPARVTRSADGTTVINMGAKGTMTQKLDMNTKVLHIDSDGTTMAGFANQLTQVIQMGGTSSRQVVDQTGLTGYYQVAIEVSLADLMNMAKQQGVDVPAAMTADADNGASVYDSVKTLGLRLQPGKAMVDQVVVTGAVKVPVGN